MATFSERLHRRIFGKADGVSGAIALCGLGSATAAGMALGLPEVEDSEVKKS